MKVIKEIIEGIAIHEAAIDNNELNFAINVVHRRMDLTLEANKDTKAGNETAACMACKTKKPQEFEACKARLSELATAAAAVKQALEYYVAVTNKEYGQGGGC